MMLRRILNQLKHLLLALSLLISCAVLAELRIQSQTPARTSVVSAAVRAEYNHLIAPSAETHHQLRRMVPLNPERAARIGIASDFRTNSCGLRGPEPQREGRPKLRILVLGDEDILGPELPEEHTVPGHVGRLLTEHLGYPVEVLNGGTPGDCPLLMALKVPELLKRLEPDLLVVHVGMSDVSDDAAYRSRLLAGGDAQFCCHPSFLDDTPPRPRWIQTLQASELLGWMIRRLEPELAESAALHTRGGARRTWHWTIPGTSITAAEVRNALEPLHAVCKSAADRRCPVMLTTAPVAWQVCPRTDYEAVFRQCGIAARDPVREDLPMKALEALAAEIGVPIVNPTPEFRRLAQARRLFADDRPELSEYGAALYAREVARRIVETINTQSEQAHSSEPGTLRATRYSSSNPPVRSL